MKNVIYAESDLMNKKNYSFQHTKHWATLTYIIWLFPNVPVRKWFSIMLKKLISKIYVIYRKFTKGRKTIKN